MSLYKHLREAWKSPKQTMPELVKERLIQWRRDPETIKLERPTRLDRARSLGYKAKQGILVVRQRAIRGGHVRPQIKGGRKPKRFGTRMNLSKNYQQIAEERVQKKFHNLVVLNSYWVGQDGRYFWYEVILVDPHHPVIQSDAQLHWLLTKKNQSRVFHGKTAAGQKGRGMVR